MSIKRWLTTTFLVAFTLLLVIGGSWFFQRTRAALVREFDDNLRTQTMAILTLMQQEHFYIQTFFTERYSPQFGAENPSRYFQIWSPLPLPARTAQKVMRSPSLGGNDLPRVTGSLQKPHFANITLPNGKPGRSIGIRYVPHADKYDFEHNFDPDLQLDIVLAQDRTPLDLTLATLRNHLLTVGGISVAMSGLLVWLILRKGLTPLQQVSYQANAIAPDTLQRRFPQEGMPAELVPICSQLNSLLDRLENSFERERQFSDDLAHELRTPLAELRTLSEVELRCGNGKNHQQENVAKEVLEVVVQMERMVAQLLDLARSHRSEPGDLSDRVLLEDLIHECWHPFVGKAHEKDVGLHILAAGHSKDFTVDTNRAMLQTVVTNLIENAVEYSPSHSQIDLSYCSSDSISGFEISVSNLTTNLEQEDLASVFKRFWRKDPARSSTDHCGLGLAVAQRHAARMGMELMATVEDDVFRIRLKSVSANPQQESEAA